MATLDAAGIVVQDMARSLKFYRLLGLDLPEGAEAEVHVEHTTPGGFRLMWDAVTVVESFDPEFSHAPGNTISLAFLCASPQDVDDLYERVVAHGYDVALPPWDAVWGQRYASVRDPDGHTIDLFAPLE